jgi:hypothetical protein
VETFQVFTGKKLSILDIRNNCVVPEGLAYLVLVCSLFTCVNVLCWSEVLIVKFIFCVLS